MVGKAGKGLDADNVGNAHLDQFDHFAGQEPAFAVLIADGQEGFGLLCDFFDGHRCIKACAACKCFQRGFSNLTDGLDQYFGNHVAGFCSAKEFGQILIAVDAVIQKIHQIRNHSLRTLFFQQLHQMVVGKRHVFHQNLAHDAHTGLFQILMDGQLIKVRNNVPANLPVLFCTVFGSQCFDTLCSPMAVKSIGRARNLFVGAYPVYASHQQITVDNSLQHFCQKTAGNFEALIFLHAVCVQGNDRDMGKTSLFQCSSDECHIVAGPAASASLGHNDCQLVGIVFPGQHCLHDLSHHGDGRETGIVIDEFQTHIHGAAVIVVKDYDVVTVLSKYRFQQVKMNGTHLRRQDGVAIVIHLLDEFCALIGIVARYGKNLLFTAHIHGGQQ